MLLKVKKSLYKLGFYIQTANIVIFLRCDTGKTKKINRWRTAWRNLKDN